MQPPPPQAPPPQAPPGGFTPPPVGTYGYPPPPPPPGPSGEAIAALVCGVVAASCFPLGFVALYFGAKARRMAREDPQRAGSDQLALVGMIIGGLFGIGGTLFVLAYLAMIVAMFFGMWASGP